MIKEALEYMQQLRGVHVEILIDGGQYIDNGRSKQIIYPKVLEPIWCNTLTGIVDFLILNQKYCILQPPLTIHILSHCSVELIGNFDINWDKKTVYAKAIAKVNDIHREVKTMDDFSPWIQTFFVQDDATAYILDKLSSITAVKGLQVKDTGVNLEVEVKKGVAFKENETIRSQFSLRSYRTFPEIDQPASEYVLRVSESDDKILIETRQSEDPTWKIRAIESIKGFFKQNVPVSCNDVSIIA